MGRRGEMENNKPQLMTITDKAEIAKIRDELEDCLLHIHIRDKFTKAVIEKNIKRLNQLVQK